LIIKITTSSPKIRWAVFLAIALLALAVRLPRLGERPMHTDEAVNAYITGELLAGENFHYDPQDRHGPALFAVAEPLAKLLGARNFAGLTETQLRLTPVIAGSATVLLFGAGVEMFGFIACLVAALLFAGAPLPVYYSRYFIHETLFVAATLGLILSGWRALQKKSLWPAALAGFCAALMLACKETAVIHFFALAVALPACRFGTPSAAAADAKDLPAPAGPANGASTARIILTAAAVFGFTVILLFTWFGRNWAALADLLQAVPRFAARAGGEGHEKPFAYYFHLIDPMLVLSIVAVAGIYAAICDAVTGVRKPGLPLVIYALAVFLIYSAIPYKTPWLALNLWLPLALLCGAGIAAFWELVKTPAGRWGVGIAGAFFMTLLAMQTKVFVFDQPADENNPYAYAHTVEDLLRLPARLDELARADKISNPRITVVAADPWPLPWCLRKFSQVGFWQPGQAGQAMGGADFFITSPAAAETMGGQLKNFRPEFFGVRPEVVVELWTPAETSP
jgi:uncharacterized protein (TIGR03663 family)